MSDGNNDWEQPETDPAAPAAEGPAEPMTPMAEEATRLHELFMAYVQAGFLPSQALAIIVGVIQQNMRGNQA